MRNKTAIFAAIVAVIAIALSVYNSCVNIKPIYVDGLNMLGWIVGILAILVTILIGWQIYKTIDIDRSVERKLNEAKKGLKKEIEKETDFVATEQIALLYMLVARLCEQMGRQNASLYYYLSSIVEYVDVHDNSDTTLYNINTMMQETKDVINTIGCEEKSLSDFNDYVKDRADIDKWIDALYKIRAAKKANQEYVLVIIGFLQKL